MRFVADTNVIISALIFGGPPQKVLDLAASGIITLCYSRFIQEEAERVLKEKFGWRRDEIHKQLGVLLSWGICVMPETSFRVVHDDPDDDHILECAVAADARVIVSGDRHLLRVGSFRGINIQTPREFLDAKPWLENQ